MKMSSWRQALLIAGKDLKIFFHDRGALLFSLLFPFVFVIMFQMVMGDFNSGTDTHYTVYVATAESEGSLSRQIIDGTTSGESQTLDVKEADPVVAHDALEKKQIGGYLYFPEGFTEAVMAGEPAEIVVYTNPEDTTNRAALLSIAQSMASDIQSYQVMYHAIGALAAGAAAGAGRPPTSGFPAVEAAPISVNLVQEQVGDIKPIRGVDVLIPGYLTMFVLFGLALAAGTLVTERETSTLERLVAGSATRLGIIFGKTLGSIAQGLMQIAVFWIAGILIFNVRMGNYPWATVLVSILVVLASSSVGVFLASLVKTRKAAASTAVFVSLSFAAFGGCWWPLFIMPQWLQNLAKITPHAWANSAFNKLMLFGARPADVVPEMIALLAFGVVFMVFALWRFRVVED